MSLREDMKEIPVVFTEVDGKYVMDDSMADQILALILKKLPEKKPKYDLNSRGEAYNSGWNRGFNQALSDVRSILGEK